MGRSGMTRLFGVSFGVFVGAAMAQLTGCGAILGDFSVDDSVFQDGGGNADATVGGDAAIDTGAGDAGPVTDDATADATGDATPPCVGETDAELCAAAGKDCDGIIAKDRCGVSRVIATCGTCTAPKTCGTAQANVCGCKSETDAQLCRRNGKDCGQLTTTDNCGVSRAVQSCGTCSPTQQCGAKVPNLCGDPICTPESDVAFCNRYGKNCDALTATDNCGAQRTVQSCGTCTAPQKCGALTVGICGCIAESDASFCARIGHTCGAASAADNCGAPRSVQSCGTCSGTSNTCTSAGTCGCNTGAACAGGQTCCATTGCANLLTDPNNCNACGASCGAGGGWSCSSGTCTCGTGSIQCKGQGCVRLHTNTNCTACLDTCATGTVCCAPSRLGTYSCSTDPLCVRSALRGDYDTSSTTPPTTSSTESIDTRE